MPRILIFSPYQLWGVHTVYEETLAKACQVRGAAVEYLLCDGLLPECDQHWDSKENHPRSFDLCQRCTSAAKCNLDRLGFPYRWLGSLLSSAQTSACFDWAQSVDPSKMPEACFEGNPIGRWVLSSVITYFRQYPPDLRDWHVACVYRGFLYSGALVASGLRSYLESNAVEAAILFNGRQSITRIALELFRHYGIRVLTHERAEYMRGHANLRANAHCMHPEPFQDFWDLWGQIALSRESLDAALGWLIQRRYGANLAWIHFSQPPNLKRALKAKLNLGEDKRLLALFTTSTDEVAGDPLMQGPYESQDAWVRDAVKWVGSRGDVELVIKLHPNLGGNFYIGKATAELQRYKEIQSTLPANVHIVWPEDSLSAYSLAEEADVGLTYGSTIGLEMAMLGKPVLLGRRAFYEHGSAVSAVRSKDSLPAMLDRCLHARPSRENQRQAFRLAYYYIFRFEMPFPAVTLLGAYDARPNYKDWQELAAGKDQSLDLVCDFLTKGSPLHACPTAQDRARSTAEEDAFFEELARSSDYLKSDHLERWLKLRSFGQSAKNLLRRLPFGAGDALLNLGRGQWSAFLTSLENQERLFHRRRNSGSARRPAGSP